MVAASQTLEADGEVDVARPDNILLRLDSFQVSSRVCVYACSQVERRARGLTADMLVAADMLVGLSLLTLACKLSSLLFWCIASEGRNIRSGYVKFLFRASSL